MPSSVIKKILYDAASQVLQVHFLSGRIYAYFDVPERTYKHFAASISKGSYLNNHIKGKFRFGLLQDEA